MTRGEDKEPRGEEEKETRHTCRRRKRRENRGEEVTLSLPCCSAGGETEGRFWSHAETALSGSAPK